MVVQLIAVATVAPHRGSKAMPKNIPFTPIGPLQSLCGQSPKPGRWKHVGETDYDALVEFNPDVTWNMKVAQIAMDRDLLEPKHWNHLSLPNAFCLGVKLLAFTSKDFTPGGWGEHACRGWFVKLHKSEMLPPTWAVLTVVEYEAEPEGYITRLNWGRTFAEAKMLKNVHDRVTKYGDTKTPVEWVDWIDKGHAELMSLVNWSDVARKRIEDWHGRHLPARVSHSDLTTSCRSWNRIKGEHGERLISHSLV